MPATIAIVKNVVATNFTSVLGKNYNFAYFDICYASKNWKLM